MGNPYNDVPVRGFWRPAVGERNPLAIDDLWRPKFPISPSDAVATAGSCFAQHISRAMVASGFNWLDSEPAPRWLTREQATAHGYGVFSFRTGNIYTPALLRQWLEMAIGLQPPDAEVWSDGTRFHDPLRPTIAPGGFASLEECLAARRYTLKCMREALPRIGLFVFTLGLTEAWRNAQTGLVYPMCPGTLAGAFDPDVHQFHNFGYDEVLADMSAAMSLLQAVNPAMRFLLTVSPVPLTATAAGDHVLVATTHSKSILRAAAGRLAATRPDTDYFPSFEIISAFPFRGMFFQPNMREVTREGVDHVMRQFLQPLGVSAGDTPPTATQRPPARDNGNGNDAEDAICEDVILEAFSK